MNTTSSSTSSSRPCTSDDIPPITWYTRFSFYLFAFVIFPVCAIAIVVNILTLVVLRQLDNSSAYRGIKILAVFDLLFSLDMFFMYPVRIVRVHHTLGEALFRFDDWTFGWDISTVTLPFFFPLLLLRNWTVVLVSVERFLAVRFPFTHQNILKTKIVVVVVVVFGLGSFGLFWHFIAPDRSPSLWRWRCLKPGQYAYVLEGKTLLEPEIKQKYAVPDRYSFTIGGVVLPIVGVIVSNCLLMTALKSAKKQRGKFVNATTMSRTSTQSAQQSKQILKMVTIVVIFFFVCEMPGSVDRLLVLFRVDTKFLSVETKMVFRKLALLLTIVDSCGNFFIYCLTNARFRDATRRVCVVPSFRTITNQRSSCD
ncbi:galanin receptor type 2-like [Tubulanus polymorphus]|uniref:galanin receptor type 2-like n=1 Tax=Tubulanus polymorphus TaxID=672921 RepID=UPI003DA63CA7